MIRFYAFWCRVWHLQWWRLGKYQVGTTALTGILCMRCGMLHVFGIEDVAKVNGTDAYGGIGEKRIEL